MPLPLPLPLHATFSNRKQWGKLIKNLPLEDTAVLMKEILTLSINKNNTFTHAYYRRPFAFAFAALMSKLTRNGSYLEQFNFSLEFLKFCTDISNESYLTFQNRQQGANIMLQVAGNHGWFDWAHYIYDAAVRSEIADVVTYGTAIKIFGNEGNFVAAAEAFERFENTCDYSDPRGNWTYASMIYACRLNKEFDIACQIFKRVRKRNLATHFILNAMIAVAGTLGKTRMSCELYAEILNSPHVSATIREKARECFNGYVSDPEKYTILKEVLNKPSQCLSSQDPVYVPDKEAAKKDFGIIGGHLLIKKRTLPPENAWNNRYAFYSALVSIPDSCPLTDKLCQKRPLKLR